jgi:hypothetical protein
VVGFSKTLKALAKFGEMTAEAPAADMDGGGGKFTVTPGEAKAQKARLMADPDWRAKYLNGDHQARAEMEKLDRVLASQMGQ